MRKCHRPFACRGNWIYYGYALIANATYRECPEVVEGPRESSLNRKKDPVRGTAPRLAERGLKIRRARNASGLSQAALARLLDCSAGSVGQWELGMTSPDKTKLVRLTELLDISLDDPCLAALISATHRWPWRTLGTATARRGLVWVPSIWNSALIDQARRLGIDVPPALHEHLRALVARTRSERWLEENREAIADANAFLVRNGLWSHCKREF